MIERLRVRCAGQIARGKIIRYQARYDSFLKLELQHRPAAVVSNFGVLSVISDLPRLFAAFAAQATRSGYVIVSVLNPFFWEDMTRLWWWRNWVRSLGKGMIHTSGSGADVFRYFPSTLHLRTLSRWSKPGWVFSSEATSRLLSLGQRPSL